MVVLCLRFRTGTQILIYFPVLLQISSVTLGQLLWEKHVKTPKWLTNPRPFSKRGIAAYSQRDKDEGKLTVVRATPKMTVCCPITFQLWAPAAHCAQGRWASSEHPWKMGRRQHRRDELLADFLWVLWSRKPWELLPHTVSRFCSISINGSVVQVRCLVSRH